MRACRVHVVYLMLASMILQTLAATQAPADHFFGRLWRLEEEKWYDGKEPDNMCSDDAIQELAMNIDWLEHHVDTYGSVVAKQPDIWGEARMTKHRDEYERMMYEQLNQFQFKINANITQTDSSFLAQALALSAAVDEGGGDAPAVAVANASGAEGTGGAVQAGPTLATVTATQVDPEDIDASVDRIVGSDAVSIEPTLFLDQLSRYLQHLHELRRVNEGDDTSDSPGYALNLVRIPVSALPGKLTREGWGAEITVTGTPVLSDDLLPNTFRNLVVNDLVDQLGLPMVKVVENAKLRERWRADQATRHSLQSAKTALVEWNYLDNPSDRRQVEVLVASIVDDARIRAAMQSAIQRLSDDVTIGGVILNALRDEAGRRERFKDYDPNTVKFETQYAADQLAEFAERLLAHRTTSTPQTLVDAKIALRNGVIAMGQLDNLATEAHAAVAEFATARAADGTAIDPVSEALKEDGHYNLQIMAAEGIAVNEFSLVEASVNDVFGEFTAVMEEITSDLEVQMRDGASSSAVAVSGRARRASQPVPPSQVFDIYGSELFYGCAEFFCPAYNGRQIRWAGDSYCATVDKEGNKIPPPDEFRVNLLDVQKWLQAEVAEAHELLCQPNHLQLWYDLANPRSGLAVAIRSGHLRGEPESIGPIVASDSISRVSYAEEIFEGQMKDAELESQHSTSMMYAIGMLPQGTNASVKAYRDYFFAHLHRGHVAPKIDGNVDSHQVVESLAWAVVVESALLNQRLNEDVRKAATAKGCGCVAVSDQDLTFFLPEVAAKPEFELSEDYFTATRVFQDYVRCRWPIHVFALDPREQDQNVADASARRRELQFALALGFVSGQMSANSLTQFSRELETEVETVSLNRTAVGFAHGNDTFGWRFFPRVQALDVPGTAETIWQSINGTPRDHDVRKRQLEPGMRECVAIVLMPSFVPYVDFDVRSNWFRLTNPKNAALTMKDTMKLSRGITAMRNSQAQCARCAQCYRDGEIERLLRRVDQLDRELPLQTMRVQVPYENTLGGFEMFNTGITDLAPQLVGWYGAPGVVIGSGDAKFSCGCFEVCNQTSPPCICPVGADGKPASLALAQPPAICQGEGTTLFLVGDHLSVHDTKVIAGGVCIPHVQLVSRQIMRVTIPSCVSKVEVDGAEYVAVYAATPYGVTNHLHIPIVPLPKSKEQEALEEKLAGMNNQINVLAQGTPMVQTNGKLAFDADCDPPSTSAVKFISKMGSSIEVLLSEAAVPQSNTSFKMAIMYSGLYSSPAFPVTLTPLSAEHGIFSVNLDNATPSIIAGLNAAQPDITTTSFEDGKATASARLIFVSADGRETPIAGEIPIEITLACNCCEAAAQAVTAVPAGAVPPAILTPPVEAMPAPATELGAPLPTFPTSVSPTSATAPGCNCSAELGTQLLVR